MYMHLFTLVFMKDFDFEFSFFYGPGSMLKEVISDLSSSSTYIVFIWAGSISEKSESDSDRFDPKILKLRIWRPPTSKIPKPGSEY